MAALSSKTCNLALKAFYDRLKASGIHHNVALVSVMRKLVIIANDLLWHDRT